MTATAVAAPAHSADVRAPAGRQLGWGATIGITVAWTALATWSHDPHYDQVAVLASGAMVFGTLAFARWRPSPRWDAFRFLGVVAFAQLFISSGLSVVRHLRLDLLSFVPAEGAFSFAVESALLFNVLYLLAVACAVAFLGRGEQPPARPGRVAEWLPWALAIAYALYTIAVLYAWRPVMALGTNLFLPINQAVVIPLIAATSLREGRWRWGPTLIVLGAQLAALLLSSMLSSMTTPVTYVILTLLVLHRRLPWKAIVIAGFFVLLLNPAKFAVREEIAKTRAAPDQHSLYSASHAFDIWSDSLERTWFEPGESQLEERLSTTAARVDMNWVGALIYTIVPRIVPFEEGGTLADIPLVLVPRIFYPDKPGSADYFRTRWTVRLGLQDWGSGMRTAIAIPAPAESYWNFGWAGLVMIPLVLGLVTGALLLLAPRTIEGRATYLVAFASWTSLAFLDMLVWIVPCFFFLVAIAGLLRVYVRSEEANDGERERDAPRAVPARLRRVS